MKKMIFFIVLFVSTFQSFCQGVKPTHPRIFLDSLTLVKLQNRALANTPEYQELATRITAVSAYSAHDLMDIVYEGQHYAFYYALSYYATGNTAHRDTAISIFTEYFNNYTTDSSMYWDRGYESRSTLVDVATLYDWLYTYLPEPFRTNVRNRIVHWADWILYYPNTYAVWTGTEFFEGNNYSMGHLCGIAASGYAIHSEDALNGNRYISITDSVLPLMKNFANMRLRLGDANEGWSYGVGYAISYFKTLALIQTATVAGTNHFLTTTYDEDAMTFLPMATLPNLHHMLPEGDWARESTGELWDYHRLCADIISNYSNNTQMQRIAAFWGNETVPLSSFQVTAYRWYPFLFHNAEITPLDYRSTSLFPNQSVYTDTSGTDQFIQRTGWTASDQWVSYRGGGRYGDHAHNGSGHFSVFENGWLIIDKNIQTASGIEGSDSMHNCIHFDLMNNDEMYPFSSTYNTAEHTLGKRRDLNAEYSYMWTDATPIYTARAAYYNVVSQNERQWLYIPTLKKIAVFDMTQTNDVLYNQRFGLHYNGTPTLSTDSSYTAYSNGTTAAYTHTCYPQTKQVSVIGNSVRIGNRVTQQKDYFMHLISTRASALPVENIIPVTRTNGRVLESDLYGSFHEEAGKNYCILFAGDNTAYTYDSLVYEVPSTQPLHSYIAGLIPSMPYYVSYTFPYAGAIRVHVSVNNHASATLVMASTGGVLSFENAATTGVGTTQEAVTYHVYTNTAGNVVIENTNSENTPYLVSVVSTSGQIRMQKNCVNKITTLPTATLATGLYVVVIKQGNAVFSKKVLTGK